MNTHLLPRCSKIPLADRLMKEEAVVTVRTQNIDKKLSTKEVCSITFTSAHCEYPKCCQRCHNAPNKVIPKTIYRRVISILVSITWAHVIWDRDLSVLLCRLTDHCNTESNHDKGARMSNPAPYISIMSFSWFVGIIEKSQRDPNDEVDSPEWTKQIKRQHCNI